MPTAEVKGLVSVGERTSEQFLYFFLYKQKAVKK